MSVIFFEKAGFVFLILFGEAPFFIILRTK